METHRVGDPVPVRSTLLVVHSLPFNPRTILSSPGEKGLHVATQERGRDLIRASVTLLSPDSFGNPLTADECSVVEFYAMSLLEEYRIPAEN
jgi:hypothetical protein